jgi:Protein of unknown function (DUF1254)
MIVSVPETNGRYYLFADARHVDGCVRFAGLAHDRYTGWQFHCGSDRWRPDLRDRLIEDFNLPKDTQRIDAPTPYVWIIGRTKTDGPQDYHAVHKIQEGYKITPLCQWGQASEPVEAKIDPTVDMKIPPKIQVDTMGAGKFFALSA